MADDTIFHRILAGEIPADILFQDDRVFVIRDIKPQAPTHLLVIPKQTLAKVSEASAADESLLGHMLVVAKQVAKEEGLEAYRLVINNGEEAGQSVFQLHLHVLGGRAFSWPPG